MTPLLYVRPVAAFSTAGIFTQVPLLFSALSLLPDNTASSAPLSFLLVASSSPVRHLRRKLTLRAHGEQIVLVKRKQERIEHVWMKAFLWALVLPTHSKAQVKVGVGDKYTPDVVAMDRRRGRPSFWGEAGHVSPEKIEALIGRYTGTHLAIAKWDTPLDPTLDVVEAAVHDTSRTAPIDLLNFPPDSGDRFITDGHVSLRLYDLPSSVEWIRVGNARTKT